MDINLKYFTVEEANSFLPELTDLLAAARETKRLIEEKVEGWRRVHEKMSEADEVLFRGQVDFLAGQLETQLQQVSNLGCVVKDVDAGLIDFPARIGTREAYFCWKLGEPEIGFWHGLTEGFAGRKSITKNITNDED